MRPRALLAALRRIGAPLVFVALLVLAFFYLLPPFAKAVALTGDSSERAARAGGHPWSLLEPGGSWRVAEEALVGPKSERPHASRAMPRTGPSGTAVSAPGARCIGSGRAPRAGLE